MPGGTKNAVAEREPDFGYTFPAIRGVQATREYYVSMCPLRLLPKIFLFDDEELVPELRAQRTLNRNRLPEIARYLSDHRRDYVFSAITASVDADVRFEALGGSPDGRLGVLRIPMDARFIINDGQHRRAAIEIALRENPDLSDESIAVVFFMDKGLERCQQMFADLNRHAVRPSPSLGVLYDHRDSSAKLAKLLVLRSPMFREVVEMERSTLSERSRKLFTLSAIHRATCALVEGLKHDSIEEGAAVALDFWEEITKHFPQWQHVRDGKITAGEIRKDYIHSHGIVLQALGRTGNWLVSHDGAAWKRKLKLLSKLDWSRKNAADWEGRAMLGGQVRKSDRNVMLTTNRIKLQLRIPLSPEEHRVEDAFGRGNV